MCRASFDKLVPFFVKEQSPRSCLCVYCYKAKLITISLCENWSTLHSGATPSDPCSCRCAFCKEVGCAGFLPYDAPNTVFSMAKFSNLLLCKKERLYTGRAGEKVRGHRFACVSGHCKDCQHKQDRFFNCPRHRTAVHQHLDSARPPTGRDCAAPSHIQWKEFTNVEETGRQNGTRRHRQGNDDENDEDWTPSGVADKTRQKKVRVHMIAP